MTMQEIKNAMKNLSVNDLQELSSEIFTVLSTTQSTFNDEAHLTNGIICPKCGSIHCVKNGKQSGFQRFICRDCTRSFQINTNSITSNSKLSKSKWIAYIECMISGNSLRKSAEIVGVSLKTSFFMRHKILDAITSFMDKGNVSGIIEMDETFLAESFKGNHKKSGFTIPRKSRKRGKQVSKRGISKEQICIGTAIDRNNDIIMTMTNKGRVTSKQLETLYKGHVAEGSTLCTDSLYGYVTLSKNLNLSHKRIPSGKHSIGTYNLAHVNSLHTRFKGWVNRFRGVATKFLPNYLAWFKWLEMNKTLKESAKPEQLWNDAMAKMVDVRIRTIRNREVIFG